MFQHALDTSEAKRVVNNPDGEKIQVRSTRTIKPVQFAAKPCIETTEDLDEYLSKLRSEMEKLLAENARIRVP